MVSANFASRAIRTLITPHKEREAYERNPQVDILFDFDLQRSKKCNLDLDRAFGVSDASSGTTVAEVPIPPQSGANH